MFLNSFFPFLGLFSDLIENNQIIQIIDLNVETEYWCVCEREVESVRSVCVCECVFVWWQNSKAHHIFRLYCAILFFVWWNQIFDKLSMSCKLERFHSSNRANILTFVCLCVIGLINNKKAKRERKKTASDSLTLLLKKPMNWNLHIEKWKKQPTNDTQQQQQQKPYTHTFW